MLSALLIGLSAACDPDARVPCGHPGEPTCPPISGSARGEGKPNTVPVTSRIKMEKADGSFAIAYFEVSSTSVDSGPFWFRVWVTDHYDPARTPFPGVRLEMTSLPRLPTGTSSTARPVREGSRSFSLIHFEKGEYDLHWEWGPLHPTGNLIPGHNERRLSIPVDPAELNADH